MSTQISRSGEWLQQQRNKYGASRVQCSSIVKLVDSILDRSNIVFCGLTVQVKMTYTCTHCSLVALVATDLLQTKIWCCSSTFCYTNDLKMLYIGLNVISGTPI